MSQALTSNPHQLARDAHARAVPRMRTNAPPPPDVVVTSLLTEDEEAPTSKPKSVRRKKGKGKGKGKAVDSPRVLERSTEQVRGSLCLTCLLYVMNALGKHCPHSYP